ncbi:response regulator [Psychrobacter cryohalolentis]|jgi:DNA-binding NtrC family response regulator|uniref:Response regulator receiver domain protein (CheY-like) n=1 Tax=Psychrobacter cryohalolentis (strain ATCC BAA-1226 / DSM 17306 / VKM B-2378 / K5) TaxID=335284 RepID=Q1Q9W0_PSYCK|nr:response regulator [Psychrobacter cryohalolentis]ABE75543.1 response regulator receiver domain protein (CheY-like) [Psychrobacter cryohalolentis K5]ASE25735.1 response regulator [Psychrobacter cryohalolentis]
MQKPKIAFIDDEPRILRSLKMHFRQSHDVFITTDASELMKYVSEHDVQVVISDQRMPDKQGTEVLRDIKAASPNTLRILLTGYADLNAVIDSVNEGEIYRYITKPWQNDELKQIVNKATEIAQQTQEITQNTMQGNDTQKVSGGTGSNRNILVLDDDESVYQQIKSHVKSAYTVSWASNLEQAARLLQKKRFGVTITDSTLNKENITPIVYALKNIQPDLMVLMLTEFKDAHMVIDLINKGQVYRCLPRPTNFSIMSISLDRAFDHHERLLEQPILAARHHVEEVTESEALNFSERLKGFFAKFRGWRIIR